MFRFIQIFSSNGAIEDKISKSFLASTVRVVDAWSRYIDQQKKKCSKQYIFIFWYKACHFQNPKRGVIKIGEKKSSVQVLV
jgi:hypothetical protein